MILRKLQRGMDARKDLLETVPVWGSFPQLGRYAPVVSKDDQSDSEYHWEAIIYIF